MVATCSDTHTTSERHSTPPTLEAFDPRAELDAWDECIADLDRALRDAAAARLDLDRVAQQLERLEARHALDLEGKNAEERKARLVLVLADDPQHQRAKLAHHQARRCLLDAERRITLAKERCRLLRAACALRTTTD